MFRRLSVLPLLGLLILATACTTDKSAVQGAEDVNAEPAPDASAARALEDEEERLPLSPAASASGAVPAPQSLPADASGLWLMAKSTSVTESFHAYPPHPVADRERYAHFDDNPVKRVAETPVSTFSIDVDTAAYANVRRFLERGEVPPHDAVRIEEIVNYFPYPYAPPGDATHPFAVHTEIGPSPWHPHRHLLHVGIKGYETPDTGLPPANLVFLIDVSGSMQAPDKLPLLKSSMKLLAAKLRAEDAIAIVVYAGAAGQVLESTPGDRKAKILAALDRLSAGGSTNGGEGIRLAYSVAREHFKPGGINRVILATDGDFNVGTVDREALQELVERRRASGVGLSVLGFGGGNYNDSLMQELAQIGDGNAAYIDTLHEARKVLVDEMGSTLLTIARDVKIQVEFNPATVAEYRLIGYETRHLEREDFNNDKVDAGDIGAGHTVTALYEIALAGSEGTLIEPLRYGGGEEAQAGAAANTGELAYLRLRYKKPGMKESVARAFPIHRAAIAASLADTSETFRFSAAAAGFGQLLRGGEHVGDFGYAGVLDLAAGARGRDPFGYRGEFLGLVRTANELAALETARLD